MYQGVDTPGVQHLQVPETAASNASPDGQASYSGWAAYKATE
jgi:hypothetical protein